jgi:mRNA-degrading endonuclease toxin of MazEF toxin-antitoxin module
VIRPGDVLPRSDNASELMVAVLSNSMHLQARTGRVLCCPYVPGTVADDSLPLVVPVPDPPGTLLPELVQWLPVAALGDPFGNVGPEALSQATAIVGALIAT